jgi:hypothetical protein
MKSVEELIRLLYVGQYEVKELPKLPTSVIIPPNPAVDDVITDL